MTLLTHTVRPVLRCLKRSTRLRPDSMSSTLSFKTTSPVQDEATVETPATSASSSLPPTPPPNYLDPNTVSSPRQERKLIRTLGVQPVGSRRRRAALKSSDNVPFEQMPYQCFQEARKVLQEDREIKLAQIAEMRKRIVRWQNMPADQCGGEVAKKGKLVRMHKHLEDLKVLADINDPMIKKRFEDGMGNYYLTCRPAFSWLMHRNARGHEPPDLPPSCRPEVARVQAAPSHATYIPDVCCARHAAALGSYSRGLLGLWSAQRTSWRVC